MSSSANLTFTEDTQISPYPEVTTKAYLKSRNVVALAVSALGVVGIIFVTLGVLNVAGLNAISGSAIGVSFCAVGFIVGVIGWWKLKEIHKKIMTNHDFAVMDTVAMMYGIKSVNGIINFENKEFRCCYRYNFKADNLSGEKIHYTDEDEHPVKKIHYSGDESLLKAINEDNFLSTVINPWLRSIKKPETNNPLFFFSKKSDYSDVIAQTMQLYTERTSGTKNTYTELLEKVEAYEEGK